MYIFRLTCRNVNLFSKIAVENVDWVSAYFCGRHKIIYGYNFVAPLTKYLSTNERQMHLCRSFLGLYLVFLLIENIRFSESMLMLL